MAARVLATVVASFLLQSVSSQMMEMGMMTPSMRPSMGPMAPAPGPFSPMTLNVTLLPINEVPAVTNSAATGYCVLTFMPNMITYSLYVFNLYAPTMAHIHAPGAAGAEGPVAVVLYSNALMNPSNATATNGKLAAGMAMSSKFIGPAKGLTVMEFYDKYVAIDMAYVNVHTTEHPGGNMRGQIMPGPQSA